MYDFKHIEESVIKFWEDNDIYKKACSKNKKGKKYYFLQGPPYTSGRIHMGQAWNHALKDMTLRYKRMNGFNVWDRAGYDMHGLPTEHKVQAKFGLKTKEDIIGFGLEKFAEECLKFSTMNANQMNIDLWRMGVWMDYKNAYMPINQEYMEGIWWLIKQAHDKGRLYEGLRTITWCANCATALAKHECQYQEVTEPSIFVKFKVKGKNDEYLIIWTTTPWTIAFNLAIMVNPGLDYVRAQVENEKWIMAKGLSGAVIQGVLGKQFKILEEFKGEKLEGMEYEHPWQDEIKDYEELKKKHPRVHTVLMSSEYVSLDAGSGLVHCAPGCGPEDYEIGYRNNVPAYNNIDQYGRFPEEMGKFAGLTAKTDDAKFIEALKEKGALLDVVPVEHDYAHCERCHNPVVFRATTQWFFKVEDLKEKMFSANQEINWVPETAKNAFGSWISNIRDNSITKQRFWGTPLPIWKCESCGNYVVVENVEELKKLNAQNIPKNIHKPWIDKVEVPCKCGGKMKRLPDILDVWIDAGSASWNCLDYPQRKDLFNAYFPAEFILEGKDQIRGWFNLLLVSSMVAFDKPCFKNVYMHGFISGVDGVKMSKSLGNIISPYEIIDKHGADAMRFYVSGIPAGEDIAFSWAEAEQKHRLLIVLWNIHQYLIEYADAEGINPAKAQPMVSKMGIEEKYILSKMHKAIRDVTSAYESYNLNEVPKLIESLFIELSRTYIQVTREKIINEPEIVLSTIFNVFHETIKMMATLTPFLSEKIFLNLKDAFGLKEESVHLCKWSKYDAKKISPELEENFLASQQAVQAILSAREKAKMGVRWPLQKAIVVTSDAKIWKAVNSISDLMKFQTNVKQIELKESFGGMKFEISPNKAEIGKDFKQDSSKILSGLDFNALEKIRKSGKAEVSGHVILMKHINIKEELPSGTFSAEFRGGNVYIESELTHDMELEGYSRELVRRIQNIRKESGLKRTDRINLSIVSEMNLNKWAKDIQAKVGAVSLEFSDKGYEERKESIKGKEFVIGIIKAA